MRKIFSCLSLFVIIPLTACGIIGGGVSVQPTQANDSVVQTQVAQVLTSMPTNPGQTPIVVTATPLLPTVAPEVTATAPAAAQPTPTAGSQAAEPTAVPPTATATQPPAAPTATNAPAATATQPPAPAFTPPPDDPRTRLGNPTSTDPMDNATAWVWPTGSDKYTEGEFGGGFQTVTALTGTDGWRLANPAGRDFANLYLEATIRTSTCSGSDHYGLMVRVPVLKDAKQGYLFSVTCDGKYSLRRWDGTVGTKGEMKWLVNWTASSAIAAGSNQTNRQGIFTVGNRLILYANGKLLTEVKDATFPSGYFGVMIGEDNTREMIIQVDSMSYWENPKP